jgi:16S rRNA C967 or C1407 C5-methylase (RsmB/RsmF family)
MCAVNMFFSIYSIDPQQGERILDMCAAPGGKTTAIAILMRDKGEIVALDRSHNKVISLCQIQHMKVPSELMWSCFAPAS